MSLSRKATRSPHRHRSRIEIAGDPIRTGFNGSVERRSRPAALAQQCAHWPAIGDAKTPRKQDPAFDGVAVAEHQAWPGQCFFHARNFIGQCAARSGPLLPNMRPRLLALIDHLGEGVDRIEPPCIADHGRPDALVGQPLLDTERLDHAVPHPVAGPLFRLLKLAGIGKPVAKIAVDQRDAHGHGGPAPC